MLAVTAPSAVLQPGRSGACYCSLLTAELFELVFTEQFRECAGTLAIKQVPLLTRTETSGSLRVWLRIRFSEFICPLPGPLSAPFTYFGVLFIAMCSKLANMLEVTFVVFTLKHRVSFREL